MAAGEFIIKQNDTLPILEVCLFGKGNLGQREVMSLAGATGVTFSMVDSCGDYAIMKQTAQITNMTAGTIQHSWTTADTSEAGKFNGEFEITYTGGGKMSVPQIGGIPIRITEDISPY
jgi:hypothetical protein